MAPEVANYTDKAKLQRCKPDFMLTNLTSRKTSTGASAAGTISPREGHGQLFSMFKARSPVEQNLSFEHNRMVLFDASNARCTKQPSNRDNFV